MKRGADNPANDCGANAAQPSWAGPLQNAEYGSLAGGAGADDHPFAAVRMHILREAADEGFVGFGFSIHFFDGAELHGEPDAVVHVPSRLLGDAERPRHFIGADAVLAVGDHPNGDEPLIERQRAILKDRPDLRRELLAGVLFLALPKAARRDVANVRAATGRARNAVRPAKLDHVLKGYVRVCKVPNGFH